MNDARIVINVSDTTYAHHNGLSGNYIVPAKPEGEPFGILVIYSAREVQDVGSNKPVIHWPSSTSVATDVLGTNSDATAHVMGARGGAEKWGIFLCEANPDIPRDLLEAEEAEIHFLNTHRPVVKQKRDPVTRMMLSTTNWEPAEEEQVIELSDKVQKFRSRFERDCRKLVTPAEIAKAKQAMRNEDARLVAEGDTMWAGNEFSRKNISELHKAACRRTGQSRPWSYRVEQNVDCPGCGAPIHENILACPSCHGWLDHGIEELRALPPKIRKKHMYPEAVEAAS